MELCHTDFQNTVVFIILLEDLLIMCNLIQVQQSIRMSHFNTYLGLRHYRLLASGLLVKIFNFDVNFYKKLVASAKVDLGFFGYTLQYNFC